MRNGKITAEAKESALALMAQQRPHAEIIQFLKDKYGTTVTSQALSFLKRKHASKLVEYKAKVSSNADKILDKSRDLIELKLEIYQKAEGKRQWLFDQWQEGKITSDEYAEAVRYLPQATLAELSGVSKEAFSQKQTESGKTPVAPEEQRAQQQALLKAIESGDEVALERIIFNPKREIINGN